MGGCMGEGRIRVYALARELGLPGPVILDMARRLGYAVINQLSWLDTEQRTVIAEALARVPRPEPSAPPAVGPCITAHPGLLSGICPWCGRVIRNGHG
jgi:hypothetical protein